MTTTRRHLLSTTGALAVGTAVAGCFGSNGGFSLDGENVLPVPVAGDPEADVTVTVFEDFGCPACMGFKTTVYPVVKSSYIEPGEIRYEHRDFPIPADPSWSFEIAGAARSVQSQAGDEAFWAFAERIYDHQGEYSTAAIETVVTAVNEEEDFGLDAEAVVADVDGDTYRAGIEAERDRGEDAGVGGTPTVIVDGEETEPSLEAVDEAIADAL